MTTPPDVLDAADPLAAFRERFPALKILAGGQALEWAPDLAHQLKIVTTGDTPEQIVAGIESMLLGGEKAT